ncbi:hypothetical protein LTR95_003054 [Oleoguttula sp. CCFEE 5521]
MPSANPAKRKRTEYDNCTWCFAQYEVNKNDRGSCKAHSGSKNVDYDPDFWADHDDAHGDPEMEDPETYDEGAVWSCCKAPGYERDCARPQRHMPESGGYKSQRL